MIYTAIKELVNYGERNGLITKYDRVYMINKIIGVLGLDEFEDTRKRFRKRALQYFKRNNRLCGEQRLM